MRILALLILLSTGSAWSKSEANCQQVDGIYKNSSAGMDRLKFESLVDIFSFNNAKDFTITIAGEELFFSRTSIDVTKNTNMNFVMIGKGLSRTAVVQMDRTPNAALKAKAFYGNIVINSPITEWSRHEVKSSLPRFMTYNFYCTF
jgi:hypothetical protein